jgi:hypothetical protein
MLRPALVLSLALGLLGCKGDDKSSSAAAQSCETGAAAFCKKLFECSPEDGAEEYGTVARCQVEDASYCHQNIALPGAGPKAGSRWVSCEKALAALSCEQFRLGSYLEACRPDPGLRLESEPCSNDGQCDSSNCYYIEHADDSQRELTACGQCRVRVGAGADCVVDVDRCEWGTECIGGTCLAPAGEFGACSDERGCLYSLSCVEGICRKRADIGEVCESDDDCLYWWSECAHGVCAHPEALALGAVCDPDPQPGASSAFCGVDSVCDPISSTCVPLRLSGEACTTHEECLWGLACQSGKCAPLTDAMCAMVKAAPPAPN